MAIITGTAAANLLNGTANADEISGLGGDDTLNGVGGKDTLVGGAGTDSLVGGGGDDTYIIDASDTLIETGTGTDTVRASFSYILLPDFENLILTGAASINGTGNSVANEITGNNAANTLNGAGGNDTLIGGSGNDSLLGGAGNDSLNGGAGSDTMKGGTGNDTYVVNALSDVVTEAAAAGTDLIQSSVTIAVLAANVEKLTLTGVAAINGTGNGLGNTITGNAAANQLSGSGSDDTLIGGGGDDTLIGGSGTDSLAGGSGNDTYTIDALDTLLESSGIDIVRAAFTLELFHNFENLVLTGNSAINGTGNSVANTITGNAAANVLNGGTGADALIGLGGGDTYVVDNVGDTVTEAAVVGTDLIESSVTIAVLAANVENLMLIGVNAINGTGNDLANTITGNAAANVLHGGMGNDTLNGGGGNDTLIHDAADASVQGGAGSDTLRISGSGVTLDLTATANAVHADLEVIDLTGAGNNTLVLAVGDLMALSTTTDTLRVDGNAGDVVTNADAGWLHIVDVTIGAQSYAQYTNGAATLQVDLDVDRSGIDATESAIQLSSLNGVNGFRLDGYAVSGHSVASAGDVNGDGLDDLIIGAVGAPGVDFLAGASYVVFGKASGFTSSVNLSTLDGTSGFRLDGIDAYDFSGHSVASAGDVNADGFDDLIIGAPDADPSGDSRAGETYVVFGKSSSFASSMNLSTLDGMNGFRLDGIDEGDSSGLSVASAGDVNGDGFDDLITGAYGANYYGGASCLVFGKASGFTSSVDLAALNGTNGFRLHGGGYSGCSVASAGDVNGDGFDDLIIGARAAAPGGDSLAGESYVVFGKSSGFASSIDLATLNGTNGFRLDGIDPDDRSGNSVASAGDVNGDGFDDIIIGAFRADPGGDSSAGETYVVFGKSSGYASSMDLAMLDSVNGFRLDGIDQLDYSGFSVSSAGDVNGDGFDDLIIGAHGADPENGSSQFGETYVVFGEDFTGAVTHLGTSDADSLVGTAAAETFVSGQGNDTLTGGGGADVFNAGAGEDLIQVSSTTFAKVDGGSGIDTLALLGDGHTLDLTALANNKISGLETIDITGSGDNTLELAILDLFDLSDTTNVLTVDGNTGDTVNLEGAWSAGAPVGGYDTYTQGAATILIDADIFVA